jgi:hypothetical protein
MNCYSLIDKTHRRVTLPTMKNYIKSLATFAAILFATGCSDHEHGDHEHGDHEHGDHEHGDHEHGDHEHGDNEHAKKTPGPNGGRILTDVTPNLEFLVREDRKIQISALADAKAIPVTTQSLTLVGGDRANPTTLEFIKDGDVLVSSTALPAGENFPVILQIKTSPTSDLITQKFQLNLKDCPDCKYKEYACICDHDHD